LLYRAGISPELVSRLALRVRGLMRVGDLAAAAQTFGPEERAILGRRFESLVGDSPELHSFVSDCLDHLGSAADLTGFYLHLVHVTRMMQLLTLARRIPFAPPTGSPSAASRQRKKVARQPNARAAKKRKTASAGRRRVKRPARKKARATVRARSKR
jgi:hypothetical protein